jgi:hypothetical protein
MRRTLVHWAGVHDQITACGRVALLEDGTRLLETDTDLENQVDCKTCLRRARALKERPNG